MMSSEHRNAVATPEHGDHPQGVSCGACPHDLDDGKSERQIFTRSLNQGRKDNRGDENEGDAAKKLVFRRDIQSGDVPMIEGVGREVV